MATGYTLTGAATFTNADPQKVLELIISKGKGVKDHYSFETGVKYKKIIPWISNVDVNPSTGDNSGYIAGNGSSTVVDVTVENTPLSIKEDYKPQAVQKYVIGLLAKSSNPEEGLPLIDLIDKLKKDTIHEYNEKFLWTATTDTSTTVQAFRSITAGSALSTYDGILEQVKGVAGEYGLKSLSLTNLTDASVLSYVNSVRLAMETTTPALITVDTVMSMSPANFTAFNKALYGLKGTINDNTLGADGLPKDELVLPGTRTKVISEIGLTGQNDIFLTYPENVIAVYDLLDEDEKLDWFYSQDAAMWIMRAWYKLGAKVVDPSACFITSYAG